jgi:DNA-binding response OmpR family regulator
METAMSHVLVFDYDHAVCSVLSDYLSQNEFRVTTVGTVSQLLDCIAHQAIDLLLLEDAAREGLRLTRTIRESSRLPIMILTKHSDEVDRVMGLELGADDYITKPFSPRELLARTGCARRRGRAGVTDGTARCAYRFSRWNSTSTSPPVVPQGVRGDIPRRVSLAQRLLSPRSMS